MQQEAFGDIRLRKHKMFDVVFSGGAINTTPDESLREIDEQYQ
jgi:hypothetical protein